MLPHAPSSYHWIFDPVCVLKHCLALIPGPDCEKKTDKVLDSTSPRTTAETTRDPKRILWVRVGGCLPLNSGGRIRSHHTLTHMLGRCRLHLLELHRVCEAPFQEQVPYAHALERVLFPGLPAWSPSQFARFAWPLLRNYATSREPFALERYHSRDFFEVVKERTLSGEFDLVVCDGLAAAAAFEGWEKQRGIPAVLFQHNVEALIWERLASVRRHLIHHLYFHVLAKRMRRREPELCRLFDGVITISQEDAAYHRDSYGLSNVLGCVPAGASTDPRGAPPSVIEVPESPCIAFLGSMDWLPNQDAVVWFIEEILPRLRKSISGIRISVIGRNPPDRLLRLTAHDAGIQFTGTVEDVSAPLRECTLMVVPLRAGSGARIKILESMAAGVPVVSTTVGAEGLPLNSNQDLLMADDVPGITNAILRLLNNDELRRDLAENGLRRIARDFSWSHSADCFFQLTAGLKSRGRPAQVRAPGAYSATP